MRGYLRKEVAEITGVPPATIQQYTDKGMVKASFYDAKGRGTSRLYTPTDMVRLLICRELVTLGVRHQDIIQVFNAIEIIQEDRQEDFLNPADAGEGRYIVIAGRPTDLEYPTVHALKYGLGIEDIKKDDEDFYDAVTFEIGQDEAAIVLRIEHLLEQVREGLKGI